MRKVFAWVASIAVTLAIWAGVAAIGDVLNIASQIDLSETITVTRGSGRGAYDEDIDSIVTSFGSYSAALGLALGCWAGMTIWASRWNAGFDRRELFTFLFWVIGIVILVILSVVIERLTKLTKGLLSVLSVRRIDIPKIFRGLARR